MPKKYLVIRLSSMGDVIFTSPLVRVLQEQTDAQVHFLVKESFAEIVEHNPHIHKVFLFKENLDQIIDELKAEAYDGIIDLQDNIRSRLIASKLKGKTYRVNKLNFKKWLKIFLKLDYLPSKHFAERCIEAVESLQVKDDGKGMEFYFPRDFDYQWPGFDKDKKYAVLIIGAKHYTKRIPFEKLNEIIDTVNYPLVLLGGKDVKEASSQLKYSNALDVIDLIGQTSITESAYIIGQSSLVMAPDTGMLHLAAALKKPTISIWGSTIPEFGVFPYYGLEEIPHIILEDKTLSCRPCSKHGSASCPKGHFKCMNMLDVLALAEKFESLID